MRKTIENPPPPEENPQLMGFPRLLDHPRKQKWWSEWSGSSSPSSDSGRTSALVAYLNLLNTCQYIDLKTVLSRNPVRIIPNIPPDMFLDEFIRLTPFPRSLSSAINLTFLMRENKLIIMTLLHKNHMGLPENGVPQNPMAYHDVAQDLSLLEHTAPPWKNILTKNLWLVCNGHWLLLCFLSIFAGKSKYQLCCWLAISHYTPVNSHLQWFNQHFSMVTIFHDSL